MKNQITVKVYYQEITDEDTPKKINRNQTLNILPASEYDSTMEYLDHVANKLFVADSWSSVNIETITPL